MSDGHDLKSVLDKPDPLRSSNSTIRVWDRFIRFFHWSLVCSIVLSYWAAKAGKHETHALLGYFLVGLILARLVWGIRGSTYARFNNFVHAPHTVLKYLKSIGTGNPRRHLGHNPAGGVMVIALLAALAIITVSGLVLLAVIDFDGPLVGLVGAVSDQQAYAVWGWHAITVNILSVMVGLHLLGVVLASIQHKENLVRAMITGHKHGGADDVVSLPETSAATESLRIPLYPSLAEENQNG